MKLLFLAPSSLFKSAPDRFLRVFCRTLSERANAVSQFTILTGFFRGSTNPDPCFLSGAWNSWPSAASPISADDSTERIALTKDLLLVITRGIREEEEEEAMKQAPAHMAKYQHKKEEEDMKFSYKRQTKRKRKKEDLQFSYKYQHRNKEERRHAILLQSSKTKQEEEKDMKVSYTWAFPERSNVIDKLRSFNGV